MIGKLHQRKVHSFGCQNCGPVQEMPQNRDKTTKKKIRTYVNINNEQPTGKQLWGEGKDSLMEIAKKTHRKKLKNTDTITG